MTGLAIGRSTLPDGFSRRDQLDLCEMIPDIDIGAALDKLMIERQNAKLVQQSLDNLKTLSEAKE